jgi:transposase
MTSDKTATRRRYSPEFKAQVMRECDVPGASVAKVAMSHGINTNVVHGWRKLAREGGGSTSLTSRGFVPVTVEPSCARPIAKRDIEVEFRRGTVTMKVIWPLSAAGDFAAWTRELLR